MAASDATPYPVKNQAYRVTFPIFDNDGDLVTGATALDSEVSKDGGTFADVTAEATEIATSSGMYYLDLTAAEMNADTVAIIVKTTTTDAKTTPIVLYPQTDGLDRKVDVTHWNGTAVATPTTAGVPEVDVTFISGDGTAADNAESFFDGTGYAGTNNVIPEVTTLTGHTAQTGDTYALANGATGFNAINTDVESILTDTGTTLETHLTDIKGATFSGATDSLEAIRDRGDSAWTTGAGGTPPQLLQSTTIATLASQTSFTLTAGSADDNAYNGAVVVVTDQSTATQKAVGSVSAYTGSTKTVTLTADPAIFTMAVGDSIDVIANASTAPSAAAVADAVWDEDLSTGHATANTAAVRLSDILVDTNELQSDDVPGLIATLDAVVDTVKAETALIVADTNELQTDLADGGRLDLLIDAILADTGELQTDLADGGRLDLLIDAILADTGELQTDLTNGGRLDLLIDAILADTGELQSDDIPGLIAALDAVVDTVKAETALIVADTNELQTDLTDGGRLDLLIDAILADTADMQPKLGTPATDLAADIAATATPAEVATEISDALHVDTTTAPTGPPSATAPLGAWILWLGTLARNKMSFNKTTGVHTLRNDADSADIATSTAADDGTTVTRPKWS